MAVTQLSVFVENRKGHLARILDLFEGARINVRGFSASDTGDYGIARFVVDDPKRGLEVLKAAGAAVKATPILCARLKDTPGELARVMRVIADTGVNVVYCYSLIATLIALHVSDVESAEKALAGQPIELISQSDLI